MDEFYLSRAKTVIKDDMYVEMEPGGEKIMEECFEDVLSPEEEEHAQIAEAFRVFDLDNDGILNRYELTVLLRERLHLDMTDDDMDEFIGMADTSGKGQIDFQGFYKMMSRGGTAPPSRIGTGTNLTRQNTVATNGTGAGGGGAGSGDGASQTRSRQGTALSSRQATSVDAAQGNKMKEEETAQESPVKDRVTTN